MDIPDSAEALLGEFKSKFKLDLASGVEQGEGGKFSPESKGTLEALVEASGLIGGNPEISKKFETLIKDHHVWIGTAAEFSYLLQEGTGRKPKNI